jgi:SAM-dependent methyltransferase
LIVLNEAPWAIGRALAPGRRGVDVLARAIVFGWRVVMAGSTRSTSPSHAVPMANVDLLKSLADLESIDCVFCGPAHSDVTIVENDFEARQCSECGLIFLSPRPSRERVADLYRLDEAHDPAELRLSAAGHPVGRLYARHELRQVRRHAGRGRLLEVGAGNGNVLVEARRRGFDVRGVELNPIQAAFIRDQLGIPCFESLDEVKRDRREKPFDVIYHRDVLSHFFDPLEEFSTLNGLLVDGGTMVFETGNLGDVDHSYFRHIPDFQLPDHLFFFSERSIDELLRRTGFIRVATSRYSILPQLVLIAVLRRLLGGGAGSRAGRATYERDRTRSSLTRVGAGFLRTTVAFAIFGVRYGIGAVAPKRGRPQTVIITASKRRSAVSFHAPAASLDPGTGGSPLNPRCESAGLAPGAARRQGDPEGP